MVFWQEGLKESSQVQLKILITSTKTNKLCAVVLAPEITHCSLFIVVISTSQTNWTAISSWNIDPRAVIFDRLTFHLSTELNPICAGTSFTKAFAVPLFATFIIDTINQTIAPWISRFTVKLVTASSGNPVSSLIYHNYLIVRTHDRLNKNHIRRTRKTEYLADRRLAPTAKLQVISECTCKFLLWSDQATSVDRHETWRSKTVLGTWFVRQCVQIRYFVGFGTSIWITMTN